MFRRRQHQTRLQKIKNLFWPATGWKSYGRYITARLSRLNGTPYSVAAGVACGVAISFTPFVGFHFVLAAATAWLIRGNIVASAFGTIAGNPWTFPFIWISVLYSGRWMLGEDVTQKVDFTRVFEKSMHALITFDFSSFGQDVWPIIGPMLIGCIPFYILAWLISYFLVKRALDKMDKLRKIKRMSRKV